MVSYLIFSLSIMSDSSLNGMVCDSPPPAKKPTPAPPSSADRAADDDDFFGVGQKDTITRLIIKDITLENFKSWSGRKVVGPFHTTFTSIIGPNGSGKSNIIDALLFIFGKKAKRIRLKQLKELIHNSAEEGATVGYARVDVR